VTAAATAQVQAALQIQFSRPELLELALMHRSYAFEAGGLPTNERLEFLGDAVLGLVITDLIFNAYPEASAGRLTKIRAAAVNTRSLAEIARGLGLGEQVRLGRGEEQSGGRDKDSILADTLEAILGAIFIDKGMAGTAELVTRLFSDLLEEVVTRRESLDHKTSLQELTAGQLSSLPTYELTEEGPDHEKRFTAAVTVGGEMLGRGSGRSKKEAEQGAAGEALAVLKRRSALTSASGEDLDGHAGPGGAPER